MNRRDFLRLRTGPRGQTLELSCERLYMQCLDARLGGLQAADEAPGEDEPTGEPPAVFDRRTPGELFDDLNRDLLAVDTLRVLDRRWLADAELSRRLEEAISRFQARGGHVEFSLSRRDAADM